MTATNETYRDNNNLPLTGGEAITPHATTQFTRVSRAIYVGVAGDVTLLTVEDDVLLFKAVPAGTLLPIRAKRVNAVGTTATDMVALW